MIHLDLPGAALKTYAAMREDVRGWPQLILGAYFSGLIAFLGIAGGALVSGKPFLVGAGAGMVAAAAAIGAVLLSDEKGRQLLISLPRPVTEAIQEAEQTTIFPSSPLIANHGEPPSHQETP